MRIEVIDNGNRQTNVQAGVNQGQENTRIESAGGDIFIDLSLNRKEVYLGEHITATIKIYTRVNLAGINEIKYPPFTGFLKADLETPPLSSLREENVNGTVYGTGVIQQVKLLLIPFRSRSWFSKSQGRPILFSEIFFHHIRQYLRLS
jgi:hypothetical protein